MPRRPVGDHADWTGHVQPGSAGRAGGDRQGVAGRRRRQAPRGALQRVAGRSLLRARYRIAPAEGRWELTRRLGPPAVYNTQQEAIAAAQALARTRPGRIVWAGPEGRTAGWEGYRGSWRFVVLWARAQRRVVAGTRALLREQGEFWRARRKGPGGGFRRAFLGSGPLRAWRQ